MKNFVQPGESITVTAPSGGVSSGDGVLIGSVFGIAAADAAEGDPVELATEGVFSGIVKVSAQAWAVGDPIYWDAAAAKATSASTGNRLIGHATEAAANPTSTGTVRLVGGSGLRVAFGQHTIVAAADTVATGLSTVVSVVASLDTDPADATLLVSATVGDQAGTPAAGSVILKSWKTDGADPTPAAATSFGAKLNWIAVGT
ncbi:MAG: DUF2190 family protein [Azospirillum sp.]|nr:DUF2190 family protein [Azospirillum sp.]